MSLLARMVAGIARLLGRRRSQRRPMVSLVILLREPAELSDSDIVDAIRRALPTSAPQLLPTGEMAAPGYAAGAGPCRTIPIAVNRNVFGVLIAPFPYSSSPGKRAVSSRSDFMDAYASHRAWIAVDFVAGPSSEDVYSFIGQIAAEFVLPSAVMLYLPALNLASLPAPNLIEAMRQGEWLDKFQSVGRDAIYSRAPDDPALQEAAREARGRFDEFVAAFRAGIGRGHSAKFVFTDGEKNEHMWVEVSEIEGERISGRLGNEPHIVANIDEGDRVSRTVPELEDWLYMKGEEMVGGFSVRVILSGEEEEE